MKIGIETQCLTKTIRGVGFYTLTLLEALKRENEDVRCFSFQKGSIPFENSIKSLFRGFEKVDLIHFPEPKILYGMRPKVPIVLTIHDVMPLLFPKYFPRKSHVMMRWFLPRYLKEADAILCPSQQTKSDLLNFFSIPSEKVHIIPLAIPYRDRVVQKEKDPFLLYVGSFEPRKNVPGILHAFAKIRKEGFPHRLVLAGKEEGAHRIPRELIAKLKLSDAVDIMGYLTEEEKAKLLQKAALLLWPSFYEGFGLPLLEAMASGTPIVTSKGSSIEEVVGNAGMLVNPFDEDDIAKGAIAILSDLQKRDSLIEKGLEKSKDFSIDLFVKRHLEIYSMLTCS